MTNKLAYVIEQLIISIVGGLVSGLLLTWLLRPELKKILSKESLKKILSKEVLVVVGLVIFLFIFGGLVHYKILPPLEFHDYIYLIDSEGYRVEVDSCHPENRRRLYKENEGFKVIKSEKDGKMYIEFPKDAKESKKENVKEVGDAERDTQ